MVRRPRNLLSALVRFGNSVDAEPELAPLLQRAVNFSVRALGVSHGKLMCYRPDHGDLLLVAGVGWRSGLAGNLTLSIDSGSPPGRALQTGQSVAVRNFSEQQTLRYPEILKNHGIVAALNVPVKVDGSSWGVLEVDHNQERDFTLDEIEFLSAMALLIGRPIRREKRQRQLRDAEHTEAELRVHYETLLWEADHRIKNNLQVINSILALEQRRVADQQARRSFQNVMDRVTAVSLAHDQLSLLKAGESLDVSKYLRAVSTSLEKEHSGKIEMSASFAQMEVSANKAVPLGLMLNEAVTNAAKYAYADGELGPVIVSLSLDHAVREAVLEVRDSGCGIKREAASGSGTQLIDALATQIGGYIEIDTSVGVGTTIRLVFPIGS